MSGDGFLLAAGFLVGGAFGVFFGIDAAQMRKADWLDLVKQGYVISGGQVFYVDIGPTVDGAVRKQPPLSAQCELMK